MFWILLLSQTFELSASKEKKMAYVSSTWQLFNYLNKFVYYQNQRNCWEDETSSLHKPREMTDYDDWALTEQKQQRNHLNSWLQCVDCVESSWRFLELQGRIFVHITRNGKSDRQSLWRELAILHPNLNLIKLVWEEMGQQMVSKDQQMRQNFGNRPWSLESVYSRSSEQIG